MDRVRRLLGTAIIFHRSVARQESLFRPIAREFIGGRRTIEFAREKLEIDNGEKSSGKIVSRLLGRIKGQFFANVRQITAN